MATYLSHRISENASRPSDWLDLHGDYLYRYAMLRVRDASAAEDAVQETLLAALQSYNNYEGRGSERTWLVGILKHKIIDHFRKIAKTHELTQFERPGSPRGQPAWGGRTIRSGI
jgi:RNA polymerase sigma-70 factor (ECF subfamily)